MSYSDARACAWKERLAQKANLGQGKDGTTWVVGGSLILADIYLNGAGVKRDVPLAMRFACESEEGMAELAMSKIAKLNGAPPAPAPFEFCDYAVTTFTQDFCSDYASTLGDDRRRRYFDSLKSSMSAEQWVAFKKLRLAESAYVQAHGFEVDQGGSIRVIRTIGSQNILSDLFRTEVVHFERKRWPSFSDDQAARADAVLHREYEMKLVELRAQTAEEIGGGAVSAGHLANVEKTWETYRDAWVAFARVRYPDEVEVVRAEVTLERYRFVRTISAY